MIISAAPPGALELRDRRLSADEDLAMSQPTIYHRNFRPPLTAPERWVGRIRSTCRAAAHAISALFRRDDSPVLGAEGLNTLHLVRSELADVVSAERRAHARARTAA